MLIERGAIWNGPSQWLPVDYHGKYSLGEFLRERQCENSFNVPRRLLWMAGRGPGTAGGQPRPGENPVPGLRCHREYQAFRPN